MPLWRELDIKAPFHALFPAFLGDRYPMFLDSSLVHPRLGRFSYIVADPFLVIQSKNGRVTMAGPATMELPAPLWGATRDANGSGSVAPRGRRVRAGDEPHWQNHVGDKPRRYGNASLEQALVADPFQQLSETLARLKVEVVPGLPPFQGGAVGYFGYDLAHHVERLPRTTVDDTGIPDMVLGLYDRVLAHEHASGRTWAMSVPLSPGGERRAAARLEDLLSKLGRAHFESPSQGPHDPAPRPVSNFSREGYLEAVKSAKEYIAAGDIYQVNLSQRFRSRLPVSPWQLYASLREISPVPYSAYLGLEEFAVVSASPELFLRKEGGTVETRPIKGTRPRGHTPEEDRHLAEDLLASEKDRAENVMIVDLLRNDLGKVCSVGSVSVPELYALESYATVHHLVSAVVGTLGEAHDAVALLKACFPGGSITGCPKIRAMEIIDELEPTQRGVYCGSIGFIGFNGNMDTSIVIRTVVAKGDTAYFQVGGAIVADSDPESEYQETLDKARAITLALGAYAR